MNLDKHSFEDIITKPRNSDTYHSYFGHTRPPSHLKPSKSNPLRILALIITGLLAFSITAAGYVYSSLQGNITTVDPQELLPESDRPTPPAPEDTKAGNPVNLLIIGTDDRSGDNAGIGGANEGMRSDTTLVVHISGDRERLELVSIPRDSLVDIPSCKMSDGTEVPSRSDSMFNSAFSKGWDKGGDVLSAASCTMRTVESLTNVRLDGFMVVDFAGFEKMVDAIGGVPMCIPEDLHSPKANLDLKAGHHVLDGKTALAFNRARYGIGDGSDTQRITRQQDFAKALVSTVVDKGILSSPTELVPFLDAVTSSLTATPEFSSIKNLSGLAYSLRSIQAEDLTILTVPSKPHPADTNKVQWLPEADSMWASIASDLPIKEPADINAPPVSAAPVDPSSTEPQIVTSSPPVCG